MEQIKTYKSTNFEVTYVENFVEQPKSCFDQLISLINDRKSRSTLVFGDSGLTYKINIRNQESSIDVNPWIDVIDHVKIRLEALVIILYNYDIKFNICVVQYYPNGKTGIAPHRDKEIKTSSPICGISLGQTRTLNLGEYNESAVLSVPLLDGSLYILHPPTNQYYYHSIEKDSSTLCRISLTFRQY